MKFNEYASALEGITHSYSPAAGSPVPFRSPDTALPGHRQLPLVSTTRHGVIGKNFNVDGPALVK